MNPFVWSKAALPLSSVSCVDADTKIKRQKFTQLPQNFRLSFPEPCCPSTLSVEQVTQAMTNVSWSTVTGAHTFLTSLTSPKGHARCHTEDSHCLMGCITCGTSYNVTMEVYSVTGRQSNCSYVGFSSSEWQTFVIVETVFYTVDFFLPRQKQSEKSWSGIWIKLGLHLNFELAESGLAERWTGEIMLKETAEWGQSCPPEGTSHTIIVLWLTWGMHLTGVNQIICIPFKMWISFTKWEPTLSSTMGQQFWTGFLFYSFSQSQLLEGNTNTISNICFEL